MSTSLETDEHPLLESLYRVLMDDAPPEDEDGFHRWLVAQGYWAVRELPTGEWAAGYDFIFTYGLIVGLRRGFPAYRTRWCYPKVEFSRDQVADFIRQWDGEGFPPGFWLKQKPEGRHHPDRAEAKWDR